MIIIGLKKKEPEKTFEEAVEAQPEKKFVKEEGKEYTVEDLPGVGPKGAEKLKEKSY